MISNKKRAERREITLAMIIAGKKVTRRRLSTGTEGWGCRVGEYAGPACAVGLSALWNGLAMESWVRPTNKMAEITGYSIDFWEGVSDGFERACSWTFFTRKLGDPVYTIDYQDGLEVGCIAEELLR